MKVRGKYFEMNCNRNGNRWDFVFVHGAARYHPGSKAIATASRRFQNSAGDASGGSAAGDVIHGVETAVSPGWTNRAGFARDGPSRAARCYDCSCKSAVVFTVWKGGCKEVDGTIQVRQIRLRRTRVKPDPALQSRRPRVSCVVLARAVGCMHHIVLESEASEELIVERTELILNFFGQRNWTVAAANRGDERQQDEKSLRSSKRFSKRRLGARDESAAGCSGVIAEEIAEMNMRVSSAEGKDQRNILMQDFHEYKGELLPLDWRLRMSRAPWRLRRESECGASTDKLVNAVASELQKNELGDEGKEENAVGQQATTHHRVNDATGWRLLGAYLAPFVPSL
ncbi:hypothetical protein C8R43DRAFT_959813 [Mycena crocata]|nr:hypothetical protein C8R43DRAFT_959813 [Mycena crocata]